MWLGRLLWFNVVIAWFECELLLFSLYDLKDYCPSCGYVFVQVLSHSEGSPSSLSSPSLPSASKFPSSSYSKLRIPQEIQGAQLRIPQDVQGAQLRIPQEVWSKKVVFNRLGFVLGFQVYPLFVVVCRFCCHRLSGS